VSRGPGRPARAAQGGEGVAHRERLHPAGRDGRREALPARATAIRPASRGAAYVDPAGLDGERVDHPDPDRTGPSAHPGRVARTHSPARFLKAVGPGQRLLLGVRAGPCRTCWRFLDTVTENDDQTSIDQASFTYTVVGWYSDRHPRPAQRKPPGRPNTDPDLPRHLHQTATFPGTSTPTVPPWPTQIAGSRHGPGRALGPERREQLRIEPARRRRRSYPTDITNKVRVAVGKHGRRRALGDCPSRSEQPDRGPTCWRRSRYGLLDEFDRPGSSESAEYGDPSALVRRPCPAARSGRSCPASGPATLPCRLPRPPVVTMPEQQDLAALNAVQHEA